MAGFFVAGKINGGDKCGGFTEKLGSNNIPVPARPRYVRFIFKL